MVAEPLPSATLLALDTVAPVPMATPLVTVTTAVLPMARELVAAAEVLEFCPIAIDCDPDALAPPDPVPLPPPMATEAVPLARVSLPRA